MRRRETEVVNTKRTEDLWLRSRYILVNRIVVNPRSSHALYPCASSTHVQIQ